MKLRNFLIGTGLTALLSGCGSIIPRASEEDLLQYRHRMELSAIPQAASCLKEGEYFIPECGLGHLCSDGGFASNNFLGQGTGSWPHNL